MAEAVDVDVDEDDDWLSTFHSCNDLHIPDLDLSRFLDLDLDIAGFSPVDDVSFSSLSQLSPEFPCPPKVFFSSTVDSFPTASPLNVDADFTLQEDATSPDSGNTHSHSGSASSDALTVLHSQLDNLDFCNAIVPQSPEVVLNRRQRPVCLESMHEERQNREFDVKAEPNSEDRKQQRLLRNRELAHESRQRKKSYISSLEAKCKLLEKELNDIQHRVCLTSTENAVLKEELSRLKKMKGYNGATEPAVLFEDSLPLEFLLLLLCQCLLMVWDSLVLSPRAVLLLTFSIKRDSRKLRNDELACMLKLILSGYHVTSLKQIHFDDCG